MLYALYVARIVWIKGDPISHSATKALGLLSSDDIAKCLDKMAPLISCDLSLLLAQALKPGSDMSRWMFARKCTS